MSAVVRVLGTFLLSTALAVAADPPAGEQATRDSGPQPIDATPSIYRTAESRGAAGAAGLEAARRFVGKAAVNGLVELRLSQLALTRSASPQVKTFAQRLVQDHGRTNAELNSLAMRKNIVVPNDLDSDRELMLAGMRSQSGAAFDAAYLQHMVTDHEAALELFRQASGADRMDEDFQAFAARTLPVLLQHKQMADQLLATQRQPAATR